MRINEFRITRYGQPLADTGKVLLQDFNLVSGENEDCKTLTIDALVKMMLGKTAKDFDNIDRVDETPQGYMLINDNTGKEFVIPEKGNNLTKITGLTASECRSIFVIRNSDLNIGSPGFYIEVADKLVGLRTSDLVSIKERLREIAKITPKDSFTNQDGQLKSRLDSCSSLLETIDSLLEEAKSYDVDKLEVENVHLSDELSRIQQEAELLESARKREKYEKGISALSKLETSKQAYSKVETFDERDEQTWRDAARDIETLEGQKTGLATEINKLKEDLSSVTTDLESKKAHFTAFQTAKKRIDEEIRPELRVYAEKRIEKVKQNANGRLITGLCTFSSAMVFVSTIGLILGSFIFAYILGLFGAVAAASWFLKYRFNENSSRINQLFEGIRFKAAPLNLDDSTAEGILLKIQRFEDQYQIKTLEIEELARKTSGLQSRLQDFVEVKIPSLNEQISSLTSKIDVIKSKSKLQSLKAYSENLQAKKELEKAMREQEKVLESHYQRIGRTLEENILNWKTQISELEPFKDKASGTSFDEKQIEALKARQNKVNTRRTEIGQKLAGFKQQMNGIETQANDILRSEDHARCEIFPDLLTVRKRITAFFDHAQTTRNRVLLSLDIFGEIEKEETNKVADLFGEKSSISKYFEEITGGAYKKVFLGTNSGIEVERSNGDRLDVKKLSAGTYDQLYLCIRIALGEKLLKVNKGFFIFDDPFIKSDTKRLKNQMEMLRRISDIGWQVVYFTAKDEVREALRENHPENFAAFSISHGAISKD